MGAGIDHSLIGLAKVIRLLMEVFFKEVFFSCVTELIGRGIRAVLETVECVTENHAQSLDSKFLAEKICRPSNWVGPCAPSLYANSSIS